MASKLDSPSGTKAVWTMNLCLLFSSPLKSKGWSMTRTLTFSLGWTIPELGRTQYCFGAVVSNPSPLAFPATTQGSQADLL